MKKGKNKEITKFGNGSTDRGSEPQIQLQSIKTVRCLYRIESLKQRISIIHVLQGRVLHLQPAISLYDQEYIHVHGTHVPVKS